VLPFRGPAGAAETVERVQDVFTPMPTTEGGIRATMGLAKGLQKLFFISLGDGVFPLGLLDAGGLQLLEQCLDR
jgi:hypothetical protein